ncbi:MAG: hypothetical protein Ct9H300mP8_05840 [Gammaproteobacteria bacterium]|nr:MAG: hypothetical protein Ct9H300mP8_05840 [Gammaproteobacteria bacterium]
MRLRDVRLRKRLQFNKLSVVTRVDAHQLLVRALLNHTSPGKKNNLSAFTMVDKRCAMMITSFSLAASRNACTRKDSVSGSRADVGSSRIRTLAGF